MTRLLLAASLLAVTAPPLLAQTAGDPSGHWTGSIHVPPINGAAGKEIAIEIDLSRSQAGTPVATFSQPDQSLKGLPMSKVAFDGRSVTFELKVNGGGLFNGTLADATSMTGEFVTTEGGYKIPFNLTRTGDARIAPAPKGSRISTELEGTWNGTIDAGDKQERLILKMANQADGTSSGTILDQDGSNVEIPIAITQKASDVTIEVTAVGGSFAAVLTGGTELTGTWTQGPLSLPLTFTRVTK
jgi:hypothetical protein